MSDIERMLHKALYHHNNEDVSSSLPVDGLAYFSGLNLLQMVLNDKQYYTQELKGTLKNLPDKNEVFVTSVYEKGEDEDNYYVLIAKLILAYRLNTKGNILYFFDYFGDHNKISPPTAYLKDKAGTIILPFDLVVSIKKTLMPIDILEAIKQNPFHDSFNYKLSPAPSTSFAVEHDLQRQMGFITHPQLINNLFIEKDDDKQSILFDTQLALRLLNTNYNIDINLESLKRLTEIDEKLASLKDTACIEIFH